MLGFLQYFLRIRQVHALKERLSQFSAQKSVETKKWLARIGRLLAFAAGVFVVQRLWNYKGQLNFQTWAWQDWAIVFFLFCAYAAINFLLAFGWHNLLRYRHESPQLQLSIRIYALTQLSKYIPGNIFQFAGRQVIGGIAGLGQKALLYTTMTEIFLLVGCALCFLPLMLPTVSPDISRTLAVPLAAFLLVLFTIGLALAGGKTLFAATLAYAAFVIMSGSIFLGVFLISGGQVSGIFDSGTVVGAFAISWLVGLVTPGAPAGLGVREAILIVLLKDFTAESVIIMSVLTGRLVTTLGDIVFFGLGHFFAPKHTRSNHKHGSSTE